MKKLLVISLLFNSVISFGQVPNYVTSDSLIGWWGFNGNANDATGNGYNGTVNGATLSSDRFGNLNNSYDFDGINDNININVLFDEPERSVFGWFNSSSSTGADQVVFVNDHNQLTQGHSNIVFLNNQTLNVQAGTYFCGNPTSLSYNTWYHAGSVRSSDSTKYYLNAQLLCTIANDNINSVGPFSGIIFGSTASPDRFFNGKIDDFGIWNRALDYCEIQDLYNASLGNCCTINPITSQPTNQTSSIGNDATFDFSDNLSAAAYQWQMNAGIGYSDLSNAGQFSGTDTQTLTISSTSMSNNNTLYRCIISESATCLDTTDVVTLTVSESGTSINELNNSLVKLFPNPSNGIITITIAQHSNGQIILTDILGKEILSKIFNSNEIQLNLKRLESKGTYFAKILDIDSNVIAIKKLIYQ